MRLRNLLLAGALLAVLAVPGDAQYQTYTFPRLTVLGPITTSATSTMGIGSGTAAIPSLGFTADADGSGTGLFRVAANSPGITTNGTVRWWWDATGNLLATDNLYDIGATGATRPRNLFLGGNITVGGTVTVPAGSISRASLTEDALALHGVTVFDLRQTTGIPLVASETAGNFNVSVAANVVLAQGEITDNETEVSVTQFQYILPPGYQAAGDVTIRITCVLVATGTPTDNGSTVDISAYYQFGESVGSDLVTTAAQTFAALDQSYTKVFELDEATLAAGATLNVVVTSSVVDSEAGAGTIRFNMEAPKIGVDIKG